METIEQTKKATIEDYQKLPEGARFELIEGHLVQEPSPEYGHQRLSMSLSSQMHQFVEKNNLGEILAAPIDVYLDEENAYQPDILFISKENLSLIRRKGIYGAPDIIIEILSPTNAYNDFATKLHIYEKHGIKEYFIVDPNTKEVIAYSLVDKKFREEYREDGVITSKVLRYEFHF
ncbi:MAG TPA: Uma2 family endonuclease [Chitinophagales bacterium]|nr:Uma2 family endonuclease [Chitinophagales bacterium]